MSIILKEESANSIPTPPSGKSTLFVDDNGVMSVKDSAGNTSFFPTVGTSNTQVLFTDGTAIGGDNDFTWDKNTNILTIVGNVAAGNVLTNNLLYANGNPWDLQQPGGSNTQIQFNDADQFGGSANFVWDKSSNTLVVSGTSNVTGEFNVSGNALIGGNLTVNGNVTYINVESLEIEDPIISVGGGPNGAPLTSDDGKDRGLLMHYYTSQAVDAFMGWDDSNNEFAFGSNVSVASEVVTFNTLGNARASNFLGNVVGDTANFSANLAAGNADLGNLAIANFVDVASNIRSNNITVNLALSGNTGNFSGNIAANGVLTDNLYYANGNPWDLQQPGGSNTQVQFNDADQFGGSANFVWDKSSNTLTVSGTSNVTGTFNVSGNATFGNANAGNLLTANFVTGTLTTNSQPNITSVGLLTSLLVGSTANATDFPNAVVIVSQDNSGQSHAENIGLVGEAVADSGNTSTWGIGVLGEARANGATKATGVQGGAYVTNTNDTGAAVGVRGYSTMTHAGGFNVGILGNAAGSGLGNYAFYIQEGNVASIENNTLWDLIDNSTAAFAFNSTGKANIFAISTDDGNEGVTMSGTLAVTGNASAGNISTAGALSVTGNASAGNISTAGALSVTGNANVGNLGTGGLIVATGNIDGGNLNTGGVLSVTGNANVGNLGTAGLITATGNISGGNLTTGGALSVTGNANVGNLGTGGLIVATGNIDGGNLNTGGVVTATGNVSGGNLTTAGALSVTGNANVGNIGGTEAVFTLLTGTLTTAAQPNVTSVGTLTSLSVTGNVSAGNVSGTLLAGTLETAAQPNITSVGTLTSLSVTGNASAGNINAGNLLTANFVSGTLTTNAQPNITSVGTLTGLNVDGSNITLANGVFAGNGVGLFSIAGANVTGTVANATHSSTANTIVDAAQPNITSVGTLTSLAVTGNVSAGNLSTGGALSVTGNANVGNLGATGIVATTLGGTLTTASQPNITSVGTLTSLSVTGNASAGNISTGGVLSVTGNANTGNLGTGSVVATGSGSFTGNVSGGNLTTTGILSVTGTGVSSIAGNLDMTSNNIVNLANPVNNQDAATKAYVDTLVSSGIHYHEPVRLESPVNLNATYNNGTAGVGATLTNAGANAALVIDGVSVNVADRILIYQQTNQVQNGVYVVTTVGDGSTAWVLTRASDADTYTPSTNSGLDEGSYFFVQEGNTGAGESYVCSTVGTITFGTTNIEFAQFSASQVYSAGTGLTLANLTFSVNASQTQITSVGTLTSLGVSGNITAANITANTGIFAGNGSGLTALNASNISSGTLAQARLANSSLTVNGQTIALGGSGTITANTTQTLTFGSYLTGTSFNGGTANTIAVDATTTNTGSKVVARDTNGSFAANIITATLSGAATTAGTVTTAAQPNITSVGTLTGLTLAANGDITLSGAGSNVQGANLVSATYLTGTLTTAAQPNITSVGTLSSLSVTGNVSTGNISGTLVTGTLTTAAQPNVTSVGTLTSLSVTGNGSFGNVSATTFTGALSGAATTAGTVTTAAQPNITSVGTLTGLTLAANADITMSGTGSNINGVALVSATLFAGSGANLTTLNGSNITTGTIAAARVATLNQNTTGYAATVSSAAQPNITSVGTLTSLAVTGNVSAGNIVCTGVIGGAGADLTGNILTTGANTTAGTITGNWTLSAGSRLNATYADLAEKYESDMTYEPGTVLLFGGEKEVTESNAFDSTKVAGVVSTDPAYVMNAGCPGDHVATIALQGRVPVKVLGPVDKGDLMVSAPGGYAKANNEARAGTIIGKSLENFYGESGIIEVVVGRV